MNNIYNTQAEQTILGAILLDKNIIHEVESLSSDVFYNEAHKVIFNRMLELHKKGVVIDIITLIDKLKFNDELEAIGGIAYLTSLSTIVPTTSNIKYYIKIVEELQQKRNIVQASYKLIEDIRRGEDINTSLNTFFTMSTQEIAIPTTVTTIDTVFAASALTYLVTLYVINTIINNMIKRKQIFFKKTPTFFMNFFLFSFFKS